MNEMDVVDEGAAPPAEEDLQTHLPFPERVENKNWKVRAKAYESFGEELERSLGDRDRLRQLGSLVCKMTADANANALDSGLDGVQRYFDKVDQATAAEFVDRVANNVMDKAFSSRPSTLAKAKAILLAMFEVHEPQAVVPLVLAKLTDKKPKVPPACMEVLLEGLMAFGASKYPVKEMIKALPAALNSSNAALRDSAMKMMLELQRWIGMGPLQSTLDLLRPAQKSDFEKQVADLVSNGQDRPAPSRFTRADVQAGLDVAAMTKASAAPDAREFVEELDIVKRLKNTEFATLLASEKWIEQSQALQILIDAIGPTPKIKQSPTTYDLVKSMHELLKNGHLQVQTKILRIVALLSDGLRAKFAADVRQLMPTILSKSKDKKMCGDVDATCLTLFKYSLGMDAQIEDMTELLASKKSPAHTKICIAVIIQNAIKENVSLNSDSLKMVSDALVGNSEDSDAKVREESVKCLAALCKHEKFADFSTTLLRSLKMNVPKLHKRVTGEMDQSPSASNESKSSSQARPVASSLSTASASSKSAKPALLPRSEPAKSVTSASAASSSKSTTASAPAQKKKGVAYEGDDLDAVEDVALTVEDATELLNSSGLDCAATAALLGSAKWQEKVDGVNMMKNVSSGGKLDARQLSAIFIFISSNTAGLKISNINVLKAVVDCFAALLVTVGDARGARSVVLRLCDVLAEKFGDKKLQQSLEDYLSASRTLIGTALVVKKLNRVVEASKSPAVHQAYLAWLKSLVAEEDVSDFPTLSTVPLLLKELENKNSTVRNASVEALGALYSKLGPPLQALLSQKEISAQLRTILDAEFQKVGFVPVDSGKGGGAGGLGLPRKDIAESLDKNFFYDLNNVEGKDSWQQRKAALEKVLAVCEGSGHYIEFSKSLLELLKMLKLRLSDTQSNLKPLAVSAIGHVIASLEADKAAKVLKHYAAGLLEGLVDNKKQMRDATIAALNTIVSLNSDKVDKSLFMIIVSASGDVLANTISRQEIVPWQLSHKDCFFGDCNELVPSFMGCLQDKVAAVRSGAEALLAHLLRGSHVLRLTIDRFALDMAPAARRTVQPVLDRLAEERVVSDKEKTVQPAIAIPTAVPAPPTQRNVVVVNPVEEDRPISPQEDHHDHFNEPMDVDDDFDEGAVVLQETASQQQPLNLEGAKRIVDGLHWPKVPSAEDYLRLLSEWQSIRAPTSLDILFGDFFGTDALHGEVASILESVPQENLLVLYWLSYNLELPRNNLNRALSLIGCASALIKSLSATDYSEQIEVIVRGCLSCASRHEDDAVRDALKFFFRTLQRSQPPAVAAEYLLVGFETSTNATRKLLSTDALIDYFASEGVAHTSRAQLIRLFQRLNIDVRLATAFLKIKLKELVDILIAKIGSVRTLNALLKREPKELFSLLNTSASIDNDSKTTQVASHSIRSLSSKVFISINVIQTSADREKDLSLSHLELLDLLRKISEIIDETQENYLDASFFLRLLSFCADEQSEQSEIILLGVVLFFKIIQRIQFLSDLSQEDHQSIALLLLRLLKRSSSTKLIKCIEMLLIEFGAKSTINAAVQSLLAIVDAFPENYEFCTRLLLHTVRSLPSTSEENVSSTLDALGRYYSQKPSERATSVKSINAVLKLLCFQLGASKLNALFLKSPTANRSAVQALALKYFEGSNETDVLSTELVSIIKEVTTSIDKFSAVRKLYLFKKNNPTIDVDLHLLKLSTAFRNFVSDTMQQLASEEQNESGKETKLQYNRCDASPPSATEALRLINNLKQLPVPDIVIENSEDIPTPKLPPQSPFARRNDMIRAGLSSLTKSLDLPVDVTGRNVFPEGLEERLQRLKSHHQM